MGDTASHLKLMGNSNLKQHTTLMLTINHSQSLLLFSIRWIILSTASLRHVPTRKYFSPQSASLLISSAKKKNKNIKDKLHVQSPELFIQKFQNGNSSENVLRTLCTMSLHWNIFWLDTPSTCKIRSTASL